MLVKAALLLLLAWFLGVIGVYDVGSLVHVLLLVGLLVLMLAVLKSRDAGTTDRSGSTAGKH
jgi:hypothetical protein